MPTNSEDFSTIPDGAWTLFEQDETTRRYFCKIDDKRTVVKTEFIADERLVALNKHEFEESLTKRFGDNPKVASVPLNVFYDPKTQIVEKLQQGDKDHIKWFLNRDENRMWRSFRGKI